MSVLTSFQRVPCGARLNMFSCGRLSGDAVLGKSSPEGVRASCLLKRRQLLLSAAVLVRQMERVVSCLRQQVDTP